MAIKVGDKVKATLGETVVIGEVKTVPETHDDYVVVRPDGARTDVAEVACWYSDGWTVQVIQDLPTRVGAVVRNNQDGTLYVRHSDNVAPDTFYPWTELGGESDWGDDTVTEGGFEILFEGVDE